MKQGIPGKLVYVMGPSGSGKDSLIQFARTHQQHPALLFAHRYITRPPEPDRLTASRLTVGGLTADGSVTGRENHIALSEEEFAVRQAAGLFALHWRSHGLWYGIGCEINSWLQQGKTVLVNGSRAYLHQAAKHYPDLVPVLVCADRAIVQERLHARQRESTAAIAKRLQDEAERAAAQEDILTWPGLLRITNNAALATAGKEFISILHQLVR